MHGATMPFAAPSASPSTARSFLFPPPRRTVLPRPPLLPPPHPLLRPLLQSPNADWPANLWTDSYAGQNRETNPCLLHGAGQLDPHFRGQVRGGPMRDGPNHIVTPSFNAFVLVLYLCPTFPISCATLFLLFQCRSVCFWSTTNYYFQPSSFKEGIGLFG